MGVLVGHALRGIEQQQHDVGIFDRLQGLHHRELLDGLEHAPLAANACRVDQLELLAVAFERHGNGVARGAGQVERDQALFTQPNVDQGGLAHVGPARNRQADHADWSRLFLFVFGRQSGDAFKCELDHGANTLPVRTRDWQHLAQTQLEKFDELQTLSHALGLVGHEHAGLAEAAQVTRYLVVLCADARAGVDHEQHHVGLRYGLAGLFGHLLVDAFGGIGLEATGVDDDVFLLARLAVAVVPVTGQAGKVGHDGVARTRQAVEQGGLAHIGASHQSDDGFHYRAFVQDQANRRFALRSLLGTPAVDTAVAGLHHQGLSGQHRGADDR
ncbi:hypothetical protein D9M68_580420 [compost metagenome]